MACYTIGADWDVAVQAAYDAIPSDVWTPAPAEKGEPFREVAETVRWRLYQVAGRLVRHARRWILKVAVDKAPFGILADLRFAAQAMAFP